MARVKEERILATLEPKYANRQMWHYMGGHCQTLEEELIFAILHTTIVKDALASAVDLVLQACQYYAIQERTRETLQLTLVGRCSVNKIPSWNKWPPNCCENMYRSLEKDFRLW